MGKDISDISQIPAADPTNPGMINIDRKIVISGIAVSSPSVAVGRGRRRHEHDVYESAAVIWFRKCALINQVPNQVVYITGVKATWRIRCNQNRLPQVKIL